MKTIITTLAVLCVVFAAATSGFADDSKVPYQLVAGNPYNNQLAYFSPRLEARFTIHTVRFPVSVLSERLASCHVRNRGLRWLSLGCDRGM